MLIPWKRNLRSNNNSNFGDYQVIYGVDTYKCHNHSMNPANIFSNYEERILKTIHCNIICKKHHTSFSLDYIHEAECQTRKKLEKQTNSTLIKPTPRWMRYFVKTRFYRDDNDYRCNARVHDFIL